MSYIAYLYFADVSSTGGNWCGGRRGAEVVLSLVVFDFSPGRGEAITRSPKARDRGHPHQGSEKNVKTGAVRLVGDASAIHASAPLTLSLG